jgi:RNA polymerase sigma-70 factor (ECF subfamily)
VSPGEDFVRLAEGHRRELLAHCYRMLGSSADAEDVVQETYLSAWRSFPSFEGRSSLRTWLYTIATHACLKTLRRNDHRPLPSDLHGPDDPEGPIAARSTEVPWLQPIPDALVVPESADPAAVVELRHTLRLAMVSALQHLPARQRAVLILRDVLSWRAAEVAELLGTTTKAVNSALQRARAQLAQVRPVAEEVTEPSEPARRALLDRYAAAFETSDLVALRDLLTEDATWEMPPIPTWFAGRDAVVRFLATRLPAGGGNTMLPTAANGQPAFLFSLRGDESGRPHALHVLTLTGAGVSGVVSFQDPDLASTFPGRDRAEPSPGPSRRSARDSRHAGRRPWTAA